MHTLVVCTILAVSVLLGVHQGLSLVTSLPLTVIVQHGICGLWASLRYLGSGALSQVRSAYSQLSSFRFSLVVLVFFFTHRFPPRWLLLAPCGGHLTHHALWTLSVDMIDQFLLPSGCMWYRCPQRRALGVGSSLM